MLREINFDEEKILKHLPGIYRTLHSETNLYRVIYTFSRYLDQIEDDFLRVMQSHWVDHARSMEALCAIGSLFAIRRREGEEVPAYRDRLKQTIAAYLAGVGTLDVVRQIVTATLGHTPESLAEKARELGIGSAEDSETKLTEKIIRIIENPPMAKSTDWIEAGYQSEWQVEVQGLELLDGQGNARTIHPVISIEGMAERTVNPMLLNLSSSTMVAYHGFVPDGEILKILPDGRAFLSGRDVSNNITINGVVLFDNARFDKDKFTSPAEHTPPLKWGTTTWRYLTETTRFDEAYFDSAAFSYPAAWKTGVFGWSRFNESHFSFTAAAVKFEWQEASPATFQVIMPWDIITFPPPGETAPAGEAASSLETADPRSLVAAAVDRVKAAGIRAVLTYYTGPEGFREHHSQADELDFKTALIFRERQRQGDALAFRSLISYAERMQQEDNLAVSGIFDSTLFDSSFFT